jgi:gliding motility-associated protein GldL
MSSNQKQSKFSKWYNSYQGKRVFGAAFSIGAALVILGALFKIQSWPHGGLMLSIGMFTEVILFSISAFDKPFKEYDWDKVFTFDGKHPILGGEAGAGGGSQTMPTSEKLLDSEMVSLSEGIKNLSTTAKQLATLSSSVGSATEFSKNIETATEATVKFTAQQSSLNSAVEKLSASYLTLNTDMGSVVNGTEQYAGKIGDINKNLGSLNSVYEIQLKNIQSQSDAISKQSEMILNQAEHTRLAGESLNEIIAENQKIKQSTRIVAEEANKYKEASAQLTSQISELNKVYGNMLNALS